MIINLPVQTSTGTLKPPGGYLWRVLSVRIVLTGVASTTSQNTYVSRGSDFGSDILAYVPDQTAAGTVVGQGSSTNYSTGNYLVSYTSQVIVSYIDGIAISAALPSGASVSIYILVDEYPEAMS